MVNVRLLISRSDVRISELAEFLLIRGLFFFIIAIYKAAFLSCSHAVCASFVCNHWSITLTVHPY